MTNPNVSQHAIHSETDPSTFGEVASPSEGRGETSQHYYPTDPLSGLRGSPDDLALLKILHESLECIESDALASSSASVGPEPVLHRLCKLLVHGCDGILPKELDTEHDAYAELFDGVDPTQEADHSADEHGRGASLLCMWRNHIQLHLPLHSFSKEYSPLSLAREIVEEHDSKQTPWLSELVIPLYRRWRSEEQQLLLQVQQSNAPLRLPGSRGNRATWTGPGAYRKPLNSRGFSWMKEFLDGIATCLMEKVIQHLIGGGDRNTRPRKLDLEELLEMFGLLAAETRSYRVLCIGAVALIAQEWVELAWEVQKCFDDAVSTPTSATVSVPAPHKTSSAESSETLEHVRWLRGCVAMEDCARQHAHVLWRRLVEFYSRHGCGWSKQDVGEKGEQAGEGILCAPVIRPADATATWRSKDRISPVVFTESQWLFLYCVVLYASGFLNRKKKNLEREEISLLDIVVRSSPNRSDIVTWTLQCFTKTLLQTFRDMANTQIDLPLHENHSSIEMSPSFHIPHNRMINRDFFWKVIQHTEMQATAHSQHRSLIVEFWRLIFLAYSELTALQAPTEEAVGCLDTAGDSGISARDDGHHMVEDVLRSTQETYRRCMKQALHESAVHLENITRAAAGQNPILRGCLERAGKRPRNESPPPASRGTRSEVPLAACCPNAKLNRYLVCVFYTMYHPSCYCVLSLERQKQLCGLLLELHSLLVVEDPFSRSSIEEDSTKRLRNPNFFAPDSTKWQTWDHEEQEFWPNAGTFEHAEDTGERDEVLALKRLRWCLSQTTCALLARDAAFTLMLSHAVFVLLERRGKVAEDVATVLAEALVPTLVRLSRVSAIETTPDDASSPLPAEAYAVNGLGLSTHGWESSVQSTFCLYALIHCGIVMALPWSVEGIYLTLARYRDFTHYLLKSYGNHPHVCIRQLAEWIKEGGCSSSGSGSAATRQSATSISNLFHSLDGDILLHDSVLRELKSRATTKILYRPRQNSATTSFLVDECIRSVTPLFLPPPCGTVLVLAFSRTLSQHISKLRNAYEMQRRLAESDVALEYLGRDGIFCTAEDIEVFKVTIRTAHRMIFATQLQPMGLLHLWVGMLAHIFSHLVPMAESDEGMELMPRSWQVGQSVTNCFGESVPRTGWRALRASTRGVTSPQTTLRIVLGELLAELFLMPMSDLVDSDDYVHAFPMPFPSPEVRQEELKRQKEVQCILPHAVLEVLCLFLKVNINVSDEELIRLSTMVAMEEPSYDYAPSPPASSAAGMDASSSVPAAMQGLEEDNFLGLAGLTALCKHIEVELVAGTLKDSRLTHLLRCIWAVADLSALQG